MLTYNFANIGSDPMYEFLYKCIKNDILSGKIKAGEKLPSKRSFAKNLGISVITVEGAYGLLMAEGYIYSMPKKGFYAADINTLPMIKTKSEKAKATEKPLEKAANVLADFLSNQTETDIFPFTVWTKTMREVMADKQRELMANSPAGGIMELRRSIAGHLSAFRAMDVAPERIIVGAGTEYLYGLLIQILGRDSVYGLEDPGYQKPSKIYKSLGVRCEFAGMDENGVISEILEEKGVNVVHTSPSHHFPTGSVMPISRRYELLGWASRKPNRYIIEDDYDSELRMSGRPLPTLQSIDVADRVIYMNTFTKTLCSTVRISYMVLPEALAERFYENLSFYSCTVSNFEQYTLARFIENGSFEKHINRLRNYYQEKRDELLSVIESHELYSHVSIHEKEAGVHFLLKAETEKKEEEVIRAAGKAGVKLNPLSAYYFDKSQAPENVYVMNYSSLKEENIKKTVEVLCRAMIL